MSSAYIIYISPYTENHKKTEGHNMTLDERLAAVIPTVIGYKRIVPLNSISTKAVRIRITDSRTEPTLAFLGIYKGV